MGRATRAFKRGRHAALARPQTASRIQAISWCAPGPETLNAVKENWGRTMSIHELNPDLRGSRKIIRFAASAQRAEENNKRKRSGLEWHEDVVRAFNYILRITCEQRSHHYRPQ